MKVVRKGEYRDSKSRDLLAAHSIETAAQDQNRRNDRDFARLEFREHGSGVRRDGATRAWREGYDLGELTHSVAAHVEGLIA